MRFRYMILLIRYIKEGLSLFLDLPLHLAVFGLGASGAVFLFLLWQKARRREEIRVRTMLPMGVLLLYLALVFIITTIARTPGSVRRQNFLLLHTLKEAAGGSGYAVKLIFFNGVLLAPLGFLVPLILEYRCGAPDILFLSCLVSASIECTQYLFRLGLMEGDDLIFNCLGALAGYAAALIMRRAGFLFRMRKKGQRGPWGSRPGSGAQERS